MKYKAYSPGSVTLFFQVVEKDDVYLTGSRGVGVCISRGVWTEVEEGSNLKIIVNGREVEGRLQRYIAKKYHFKGTIKNNVELPISQGFGMSGAMALSTSLALAKWKGYSYLTAARIAHEAEIVMGTGLGDVASQYEGGFTVRIRAGIQPYGIVDRLPFEGSAKLVVVGEPIKTKDIISDMREKSKIIKLGEQAMNKFLGSMSVENAVKIGRQFAFSLGVMSDELREFLIKCRSATQSLIGNAAIVFGDCKLDDYKVYDVHLGMRATTIFKLL